MATESSAPWRRQPLGRLSDMSTDRLWPGRQAKLGALVLFGTVAVVLALWSARATADERAGRPVQPAVEVAWVPRDDCSEGGSPGETIGLRGGTKVAVIDGESIVVGGDIILEVQGIAVGGVSTYEKIREALAGLASRATINATVLRAGQILELTGTIP